MIYHFGPFTLDSTSNRLWHMNSVIRLRRKAFEVLLLLVERAGQTVSKDEILALVWPDKVIEDGNLASIIYRLRVILGDSAQNQTYILTIPTIGYQFTCLVTRESSPTGIDRLARVDAPPFWSGSNQSGETVPSPAPDQVQEDSPINQLAERARGGVALTPRFAMVIALFLTMFLLVFASIRLYSGVRRGNKPDGLFHSSPVLKAITSLPGVEQYPIHSPGGHFLAFAYDGSPPDNQNIYIRMAAEGEVRQITNHPDDDIPGAWSPDGRSLVFLRRKRQQGVKHQVMITRLNDDLSAGAEQLVGEAWGGVDWSPDGRQLVVSDNDEQSSSTALYVISPEGRDRRQITRPAQPISVFDASPRFSPDGTRIAFIRWTSDTTSDLWLVDLRTGTEERLTEESRDRHKVSQLQWSADGRSIYFISNRLVNKRLWVLDVAGRGAQLIENFTASIDYFSLAPDGHSLAFTQSTVDSEIEIRPPGSKGPAKCTINSSVHDDTPRFSPDGERLVFVSNRSGNHELWLSDGQCREAVQLTRFGSGWSGSPRWSPDGSTILFDRREGGKSDLFRIEVQSSRWQQLTSNPADDIMPAWSADGQTIYFASDRSGKFRLWQIPATGEEAGGRAIAATAENSREPFPSADGRWLYFTRNDLLWRKSLPDGPEREIAELRDLPVGRFWEVSGETIYFVHRIAGTAPPIQHPLLCRLEPGSGTPVVLGEIPGFLPVWVPGISITSDGQRLATSYIKFRIGDILLATFSKS